MRRHWIPVVISVALTVIPVTAVATTITEAEFLSALGNEHAAVKALGDQLASAERASRAWYIENPGIEFSREAPEGAADQSTWALTWKPPFDTRRGLSRQAGAARLAAAESGLVWSRLQFRATLRALYADWWRLMEMEALLATHVESVNRLADRSQRRVERGEESGLDAGRLRFAASEMEAQLALLRAELVRASANVRVYAPKLPRDARPQRPGLTGLSEVTEAADHPALEVRRHQFERARLEKKLAGRVIEFPELTAGWTRISGEQEDADGPVFGVQWDLPLFDRGQGEKAMASRALAVAEARLSLGVAQTQSRVVASREAYATLRSAALDLQEATADATELINAATSAFDNNESSVTDLLEALRSILSGRRAAIDIYYEALAAHRELELSIGRPLTSGGTE